MRAGDSIAIAAAALRQNTLRSGLTMLGIAIGVATLIVVVAVGTGSQAQVQRQIESLGSNLLMVRPDSASVGGIKLGAGSRSTLTSDDADAIAREIGHVAAAGVIYWSGGQAVRGNRNWNTRIHGVDPQYLIARNRSVVRGRTLSRDDVDGAAKVAFLGQQVVDELFGGEDPVGKAIRLRNVPFTVAGVLDVKGQSISGRNEDDLVYVPVTAARVSFARILPSRPQAVSAVSGTARYDGASGTGPDVVMRGARVRTTLKELRAGSVDAIFVKAGDADLLPVVQREIGKLLRQRHGLAAGAPDDFSIRDLTVVARAQEASSRILSTMLATIAAMSLLVGGIGIMNIMLVSVSERQGEIGLRMALGARRADVLRQFLIEAVALSLAGGMAGIALGVAGTAGLGEALDLALALEPAAIVTALLFASAVGVVFGYYPARRASRLDPIVALRR